MTTNSTSTENALSRWVRSRRCRPPRISSVQPTVMRSTSTASTTTSAIAVSATSASGTSSQRRIGSPNAHAAPRPSTAIVPTAVMPEPMMWVSSSNLRWRTCSAVNLV